MKDVNTIYSNGYGISFKWNKTISKNNLKTQLVFRNTGMLLNEKELFQFSVLIQKAINNSLDCNNCSLNKKCKSILLETPSEQINFAVNYKELQNIADLVNGTIFNLNLTKMLSSLDITKK